MKKFFLLLLLSGCAALPKPVEAPISIEVPPISKPSTLIEKKETPKYVVQWTIERVIPWDTEIQVIGQSELFYKRGRTKVAAIVASGGLFLTCDDTMVSTNQCLGNGGFIEYHCGGMVLLNVSCKYVPFTGGDESIILQEKKEQENTDGFRN